MNYLIFLLGLMIGGMIGVTIMCMCQINRDESKNM